MAIRCIGDSGDVLSAFLWRLLKCIRTAESKVSMSEICETNLKRSGIIEAHKMRVERIVEDELSEY
jgi:hypothetical protein